MRCKMINKNEILDKVDKLIKMYKTGGLDTIS
jgi:hypothetical protein